MDTIKCPVCGKPGISDYHKEDVICPQCKSDLSIYRVIDSIPEKPGPNIWKPISAVALAATAVCGFLLLHNGKTGNTIETNVNQQEISMLRDSVSILKNELKETKSKSASYQYVVRKGDSYWSISQKMYGTGTRAEELANANNRSIDEPIIVGDTIYIK